jgi:hypothetical protein
VDSARDGKDQRQEMTAVRAGEPPGTFARTFAGTAIVGALGRAYAGIHKRVASAALRGR